MKALKWLLPGLLLAACQTTPPVPAPPPPAPAPEPKPVVVQPPPPPEKVQVADLAVFTPLRLTQVFGAPSQERFEGETRLMQFTNGRCVLDMVFNATAKLIHVEARALTTGVPIDIQPCMDSFPQALEPVS